MIIYEMTATFGKLEHQVLTLRPGLNVIHAPNEWGKSTWCAFLVAMLYGIDTRAKSTKSILADKEHYAPWSGTPMEGRIDLNWNDMDITIERSTRGRTPFGAFRAYETASGLEIIELTASNCGQTLLGVERSVFERAGFLRLTDLPVTQDEALRRRLNALVTTGDESATADRLAERLRELKNSIRYNRAGKLPAAEAELAALEATCRELDQLRRNVEECAARQAEEESRLAALNNHLTALRYQAAQADARLLQQARQNQNAALQKWQQLETACAGLPDRQTAQEKLATAQELQRQLMALHMESRLAPAMPEQPEIPEPLRDMPEEQMIAQAAADQEKYNDLLNRAQKESMIPGILLVLALAIGTGLGFWKLWLGIAAGAILGIAALVCFIRDRVYRYTVYAEADYLENHYADWNVGEWVALSESYANQKEEYRRKLQKYHDVRADLDRRYEHLRLKVHSLTQGNDLQSCITQWQRVLQLRDQYDMAEREYGQARQHYEHLQSLVKPAEVPTQTDDLTYPEDVTLRLIGECGAKLRQLQNHASAFRGRMEQIGDEDSIQHRMELLRRQIEKLEDTYAALEIAQDTLRDAASELQRRFAPRIAARAQELFSVLTDGRYNRLNLTRELSVDAAAVGETTLHAARWRSDGTADQLYFALRLAVAEELTPQAPLVLDDALVRFDDHRLEKAMEILRDAAERRQVIVFTCQDRESRFDSRGEQ